MKDTILFGGTSSGTYAYAGGAGWTAITADDFTAAFGAPEGAFVSLLVRPLTDGDSTFASGTDAEADGGHENASITDMMRLNDGRPVKTIYLKGAAARIDATFTPAGP